MAKTPQIAPLPLEYFKERFWVEFARYDLDGKQVGSSVTCTEDNYVNLYNSQFKEKTVYGQVFMYNIHSR